MDCEKAEAGEMIWGGYPIRWQHSPSITILFLFVSKVGGWVGGTG